MTRHSRLTGVFVVVAATIGIYCFADESGQVSPEEQGIRAALEGDFSQPPQDGIYGDIIGVIRDQGSVLDNTPFDPQGNVEGLGSVDGSGPSRAPPSKQARAAEQLLKAARLLERIDASRIDASRVNACDPGRVDLVNRMRAEAVKLLSE